MIRCCLEPDPAKRITAAEALKHPVSNVIILYQPEVSSSSSLQWLLMADGTAKPAPATYGNRLPKSNTEVTMHDTAGLSLRRTVTHIQDPGSSSSDDDESSKAEKPKDETSQGAKRLIV